MDLRDYMTIETEISNALRMHKPVVALASEMLCYTERGLRIALAAQTEEIVRRSGAIPARMAVMDGKLKIGLTERETHRLFSAENVDVFSQAELPIAIATGGTGAVPVAGSALLASLAGIRVLSSCVLSGISTQTQSSLPEGSADLEELSASSVALVCGGVSAGSSSAYTLRYLAVRGVPVLGMGLSAFPFTYCREDCGAVDYTASTPREVAAVLHAKWDVGVRGGVLVAVALPEAEALLESRVLTLTSRITAEAEQKHLHGKQRTAFIARQLLSDSAALEAHSKLTQQCARVASELAQSYLAYSP